MIVGGLVPSLLVAEPRVRHRGSGDLDLSLSVAITKGRTAQYYKSLEKAIDPFFEPAESGFRWRKREEVGGVPLLVDFLGPALEATQLADGTLALEDETAVANTGTRLRPFPIGAGRLVDLDAEAKTIEKVSLIYEPGVRADVRIRHAGPLGFLASKAEALETRTEAKDGYDVSWWCLEAGETAEEVAAQVSERPAFANPDFLDRLAMLKSAFGEPDYPGPTGYARELHDVAEPGSDEFDRSRNEAFAAVSPVLDLLLERAFKAVGSDSG